MDAPLRRPRAMTTDEFLAWEARQELRWEFDGFAPVATTGGSGAHSIIQSRLLRTLGNRLGDGPCAAVNDFRVRLPGGAVRYPDTLVACAPHPIGAKDGFTEHPIVVIEVLSPSTVATDRTVKAREYRDAPSLRRYVMLEQDRAAATVHTRDTDGRWTVDVVLGLGEALALPEIGVDALPLEELYRGLPLATDDGEDATT